MTDEEEKEIENEIDEVCPNCLAFGVHCSHRVNGDPYHYDCKMTVYVLEKENAELKAKLNGALDICNIPEFRISDLEKKTKN